MLLPNWLEALVEEVGRDAHDATGVALVLETISRVLRESPHTMWERLSPVAAEDRRAAVTSTTSMDAQVDVLLRLCREVALNDDRRTRTVAQLEHAAQRLRRGEADAGLY